MPQNHARLPQHDPHVSRLSPITLLRIRIAMADETSINFGQIFAVAVIGYLVFRWFTSPTSPSTQSSSRNAAGRQVSPAHVETVAQMFPQLDRRTIMWDLQRNGGSVPATTERILSGRSLDSVCACEELYDHVGVTRLNDTAATPLLPTGDTSPCDPCPPCLSTCQSGEPRSHHAIQPWR